MISIKHKLIGYDQWQFNTIYVKNISHLNSSISYLTELLWIQVKTISAGSSAGSAVTVMEPSTPISVLLEFKSKYISVVLKNGNEFWCKLYDHTGMKSSKINIPVKYTYLHGPNFLFSLPLHSWSIYYIRNNYRYIYKNIKKVNENHNSARDKWYF